MRTVPRHAVATRRRVSPALAWVVTLAVVAGGAVAGALNAGSGLADASAAPTGGDPGVSIMHRMAQAYAGSPAAAALPAATAPPAAAPPSLADAPALQAHEIFGFAPYWALPQSSGFDVSGLTTLAYFSMDVNGNGTLAQQGPGWVGYRSQALADLVTRAHAAGDRVVLTVTCFDQSALDQLAGDADSGARLGAALVQLVAAKNLDGVNVDFEGKGAKDQLGLDRLIAGLSDTLHQANPHWQLTMDTYGSSAGDPSGFYDIPGLAPHVDGFFVMAYDMGNPASPSPTAPLSGPGFTDLRAVQEYTAVVAPSKVVLGVPYYGYDWPTAGPGLGDPATGTPSPLGYAQIVTTGGAVYWDPSTLTPWTSYQVGTQWHQAWFDNPTSLALKAQLANAYHLGGVGIWALGMEGAAPAMLSALQGNAPIVKSLPRGPGPTVSTSTTSTTGATYSYSGVFDGRPVTLVPVDPDVLAAQAGGVAGALDSFSTDDPARSCLASGPALAVVALPASPATYAVLASPPGECASGAWEFTSSTPDAAAPPPSSTTSTTASATTPSTTTPPTSTTSTSTTVP